ncbi:MAG: two-component regulator propeller domain-containing protein [Thermoanaerobaculia bacterium]
MSRREQLGGRWRHGRSSVTGALALTVLVLSAPGDPAGARPVPAGLTPEKHLREFSLSRWSVDDGLPTNALTNVLQTRDGYLWISSFNGLIRFDGHEFTVFDKRTVPVFGTSGFHELVEDDDGDLWIGMQSVGVRRYRHRRFEAVGRPELAFTVRTVLIDSAGEVWAGTGDFGAFRLHDEEWTPVDHPDLTGVSVRDIFQSRDGALWFATEGNGVVRLEDGIFTTYTSASGLASDQATSLCEAADGTLWIGTEEGLSRLVDGEVETVPELAGTEIYRLYLDDYGNLWLTAEQGLLRKNALTGDFERLVSHGDKALRSVSALAFGREGEVWIAGYLDGLYRLKDGKFKNYTVDTGLAKERVNALYETRDGDVLVGGDGTIDVIRDGIATEFELGEAFPDVRVRGFLEDRSGRLWIGSYAGVMRISETGTEWITAEHGLPSNQVRLLYEDRSGRIWAATRNAGAVEFLADGGFRTVDKSAGLSSDFVLSIDETPAGDLLLETHEGLDVLRADGSIDHYGLAEGLPGELVFSTFVDGSGAVWLATNGGLGRLHRQQVRALTLDQGLPAEALFDYREDDRGSVWLSSAKGIIRLSKDELTSFMDGGRQRIEATVYDDRDGMVSRDCTGAAKILRGGDGRLWFPTLGGVSILDPAELETNPVEPPVLINRFVVDEEPIDGFGVEVIEIPPGGRTFQFGFAALSLLAPSKVRIRYWLEGFDDSWIDAGSERGVRYTNLSPGDYEFRVIAANNDGVWNRRGAGLAFRVRPFFYQYRWVQAACLLLAAASVGGLVRWRLRRVEARNAHLRKVVSEQRRTEKALRKSEERLQHLVDELEVKNAELESFTYTVSHDLKSPLVTITGFLGFLRRDAEAGKTDRIVRDLERIQSAARKLEQLLNDLLELSRIGRMVNPSPEIRLGELASEAVGMVAGRIAERGAEIVIASDLPAVSGDRVRLLQVFQNLIDNAVKYMGDQVSPQVEVGARWDETDADGRGPVLYVRDNGLGIALEYQDEIFGLFRQLDADAEGTGVGLALVKRIVELHRGRIWIESEGKGQGSTFCFTLPAAPAAVNEDLDR